MYTYIYVSALRVCPESYIYNSYEGTCVRLVNSSMNYLEADYACRSAGEYLVTFKSAASSRHLRSKIVDVFGDTIGENQFKVFIT